MTEEFLKELKKEQEALSLHNDSKIAIDLANNLVYHDRTNHIDVRYHFLYKVLKDGVFLLLKIHTNQNPADMFKVIAVEKLKVVQFMWVFKDENSSLSHLESLLVGNEKRTREDVMLLLLH